MTYIKRLKELTKKDVNIAGGKGASLGEMMNAGMNVPDGFIVTSNAFESFIKETDLIQEIDSILNTVDLKAIHTIDSASEKIQGLILSKTIPGNIKEEILASFKNLNAKLVAVRSSATAEDGAEHAWAGQLDSYLNVNEQDVLENVKNCWASLFTPRAIYYRLERNLDTTKISVAVVVQKMIDAEVAGVAFSVHPVTEDRNQILIEVVNGLGNTLVSGSITPDSYVIEKDSKRIVDTNIVGKFQILAEEQILQLVSNIEQIEKHYGFPCDIEWAYKDKTFYILQSRPITTLSSTRVHNTFKKEDYILSFWVQGVSVFVTDVHLDVYKELEVLYIIDYGMFKQYFTKIAYERALDRGLAFYSDPNAFELYKKDLTNHCEKFKNFFDSEIKEKSSLSKETINILFDFTRKLCGEYAKMNFEFTDKAFKYQEENPVIKKNLKGVAEFKDKIRSFMNTMLFEQKGYTAEVFKILGAQFKLPVAVFENLTQEEILSLFNGVKPSESISKRQEAFVEHNDTKRFYEGKEANAILVSFRENIEAKDVIEGQAASKGVISGKVKIIPVDYGNLERISEEITKMQQGDILVAETTAPELMIACKKAAAIVTDMGGLMSHAAIVSREFGIPCIVGTKNASKILKDGDEVEVDANNGIIKILNSTPELFELMHVDMPLALVQLNSDGETIKDLPWSDKPFDIYPYCIHEQKEGVHYLWYDQKGIDWKIEQAGKFDKAVMARETLKRYAQVKDLLENEGTLTRQEFKVFVEQVKDLFMWRDCMWWMVEYYAKHNLPMEDVIIVRKETEYFAPGTRAVVRNTFLKELPDHKEYIDYILADEFIENKIPEKSVLEQRKKGIAYGQGKWFSSLEEAAKYFNVKIKKTVASSSKELKGQTAFKGKATGKVKRVESKQDMLDFEDGDIIVSSTTTPDFLPVMKKAGAIVSEHGGAVCHAAITSRELEKPCVVGVIGVTKILKNGDLVEVDADNGIVRILDK